MEREALVELIAERLAELEPPGLVPGSQVTEDTALLGDEGLLDSLGLVNLLVDVEQALEDETGAEITIGDDRAVSASHSPFRTVGALADYALGLLHAHA
jgi:D-alanine--poly(phosphoribitol) ligase subunit 2